MSENMDQEAAAFYLDEIDARGRGLTEWELDFIDSMLKQIDEGREPAQKQADTILRIYREKV